MKGWWGGRNQMVPTATTSSVELRGRYVGDGFRAGGDGGADGGLGGVGGEGYGGSDGGGEDLHLGGEMCAGVVGDEGGDGDADYSVDAVPDEVEGGDFVGEEFYGEENSAGDENPGAAEGV